MAKTVISDKVVMYDSNTTLHDKIEALSQSSGGQGGAPITIDNALSSTSTNAVQNKVVNSALSTIQAAIDILNGTGNGSVKKSVDNAIAEVVAGAPESLDTLKELSDWISSHGTEAAAMNSAIRANQSSITTLQAAINNIGTGGSNNEGFIIPVDPATTPVEAGAVWFETDNTTP